MSCQPITKLIDTHCHLDFPEFDKDRGEVIERAKNEGIEYIINIGTSLLSCEKALELSGEQEFIYVGIGLHPHEADKFNSEARSRIEELARKNKVVAIGETGLDYYRNYSKAENQKLLFRYLIKLAKDLNLSLVVHTRQAPEDTLNILKEMRPERVQIHCFSGDEDFLKECLDLGFFISFTCNITYKKAENLRRLVKLIPLERLLLETDAPFLSPEGFRGRRNEPSYLKYLAKEVACIKEAEIQIISQSTTENAKNFFNLK